MLEEGKALITEPTKSSGIFLLSVLQEYVVSNLGSWLVSMDGLDFEEFPLLCLFRYRTY